MIVKKVALSKLNVIPLEEITIDDLKDIYFEEVYYDNDDTIVVSSYGKYFGCISRIQLKEKLKTLSFDELEPRLLANDNKICIEQSEDECEKALIELSEKVTLIPVVNKFDEIQYAYRVVNTFNKHIKEREKGVLRDEILFRQSIIYLESEYFKQIGELEYAGFQVYSQNDEDGIIQWIISRIKNPIKNFIEFGVQNYFQSNTRYLHIKDHYSGLIMECDEKSIRYINSDQRLKSNLIVGCEFISVSNINSLFLKYGFEKGEEVGVLSIDIDGNDYWIWNEISVINPQIVICEYNSAFGYEKALTIPYSEKFCIDKNFINAYFGASIKALEYLGTKKGYSLIGANGTNLFFVRDDLMENFVRRTAEDLSRKFDFWTPRYLKRMKKRLLFDPIVEKTYSVNEFFFKET